MLTTYFRQGSKQRAKLKGVAEALDQVHSYHRQGPEMMALIQVIN